LDPAFLLTKNFWDKKLRGTKIQLNLNLECGSPSSACFCLFKTPSNFVAKRPWKNVVSDKNMLLDKLVMAGIIVLIFND